MSGKSVSPTVEGIANGVVERYGHDSTEKTEDEQALKSPVDLGWVDPKPSTRRKGPSAQIDTPIADDDSLASEARVSSSCVGVPNVLTGTSVVPPCIAISTSRSRPPPSTSRI